MYIEREMGMGLPEKRVLGGWGGNPKTRKTKTKNQNQKPKIQEQKQLPKVSSKSFEFHNDQVKRRKREG